jgi:glycosyltransferase involved in cell wall biosynthesis
MNILHLEASKGYGGQERRTILEAIGMISRNHKVLIASFKNAKILQHAKNHKIPTFKINFNKKFWFISFFKLLALLKFEKINLIVTHSSLDSWLGGIVGKLLRIKVIRTRHVTIPINKNLNTKIIYNYLTDYVITTSNEIVTAISKNSNKNIKLIKSIPTGLDIEKINATDEEVNLFKKKYDLKKEDFLIGTLCIIRNWKGIDDLLDAAKLFKNHKNIKFLIIGDGYIDRYIQRKENEQIHNLIFIGHMDNPYPALKALNIFTLLSTKNEGVSQAALQAAFFKKPLITTPTGGLKEICINNKTGLLVPISSKEKIKEAILKLYNDNALLKSLSENAYNHSLKFTKDNMLDQIEEIYFFLNKK